MESTISRIPVAQRAEQLTFRELTQPDDLLRLFALRHRVYARQGYWSAESRTYDLDSYDAHSHFVGAFTPTGDLVGGARYIQASGRPNAAAVGQIAREHRLEVPTRTAPYCCGSLFDFSGFLERAAAKGKAVVEFGRTVVDPEWQKSGIGSLLVHAIYGLARTKGITLGLAAVPPHLVPFYSNLGCRVWQSGVTSRGRGLNTEQVPVIVDLTRNDPSLQTSVAAAKALLSHGEWCCELRPTTKAVSSQGARYG